MQNYAVGSSRPTNDVTDGVAPQRGAVTYLDELLATLAEAPDLASSAAFLLSRLGELSGSTRGFVRLLDPALELLGVVASVGEEMFYCTEKERTETAAFRIDMVDAVAGKKASEEFLGEIASGVVARGVVADEGEDGRVVSGAEIRQSGFRIARVAAGFEDVGPLGGGENRV